MAEFVHCIETGTELKAPEKKKKPVEEQKKGAAAAEDANDDDKYPLESLRCQDLYKQGQVKCESAFWVEHFVQKDS